MLISEILDNYKKRNPIYDLINFSVEGNNAEHLHPLFIITQYIIDKLVENESNRIAIVLPDDECNIIPMLVAKYFSNIQSIPEYAGSVLDEIEIGQHVRLGKAVAEFLGFLDDEEKCRIGFKNDVKYIKFRTGKASPVIRTCPVNGIHYMFEKTKGAISSSNTWDQAFNDAQREFTQDNVIKNLRVKRTSLNKTICLLSAKNNFKEFVGKLNINGTTFGDMITYGEIDIDSTTKFKLYNKGSLDCLPSIAVTTKAEEISILLNIEDMKDKVSAIFSTIDKFDELIDDLEILRNILRQGVPFIAFISESDFEKCPLLTDYGFELWHWKPSTMKSEALLVVDNEDEKTRIQQMEKFIENFATLSGSACSKLKECDEEITKYADGINLHSWVQWTLGFRKKLMGLTHPVANVARNEIENKFLKANKQWEVRKANYNKIFYIRNRIKDFILLMDKIFMYFKLFLDATQKKESLFEKFAKKVNRAALSNFKLETLVSNDLKTTLKLISLLSKQTYNSNNDLRCLVRKIWAFQSKLTSLICPIEYIKDEIDNEFSEISEFWKQQKCYYSGQPLESTVENILKHYSSFLNTNKTNKLLRIEDFLLKFASPSKSIKILLPNKYSHLDKLSSYICSLKEGYDISFQTLADFYAEQEENYKSVDYLIVTWFDKDEYIRIKQSYCYDDLVFILYDYENKWRESYIRKFDECIPHEIIKQTAKKIDFSEEDIYDKPLDKIFIKDNSEFEEISDYNISNTIIRSTFTNTEIEQDSADAIECIPIILSEDKIAYFYPTHDVIDVTALSKGDIDRPVKKEARKLRKGDKILVRQSDKDIIKEKADFLMAQKGENSLRNEVEIWSTLLNSLAENRTITDVYQCLNNEHAECTPQQVRYWLSGETIMPRSKDILIAIGRVASRKDIVKTLCNDYLENIDEIFESGKKIQAYHQNAGRLLTSELKSKAAEIKSIANSSIPHGSIENIGEIHVYTVEDILDKEIISRGRINKLEDLY